MPEPMKAESSIMTTYVYVRYRGSPGEVWRRPVRVLDGLTAGLFVGSLLTRLPSGDDRAEVSLEWCCREGGAERVLSHSMWTAQSLLAALDSACAPGDTFVPWSLNRSLPPTEPTAHRVATHPHGGRTR